MTVLDVIHPTAKCRRLVALNCGPHPLFQVEYKRRLDDGTVEQGIINGYVDMMQANRIAHERVVGPRQCLVHDRGEGGMMIDWDTITPAQRKQLVAVGFRLSLFDDDRPSTLAKRKQRGRGENQLERDFRSHVEGKPGVRYWAKPFILRIGGGRTFEPDAMVTEVDGDTLWTWIIDTKGPWTDGDSRLKICIAADRYPMWRWLIITRPEGSWKAKEVTAAKGIGRKFLALPWLQ